MTKPRRKGLKPKIVELRKSGMRSSAIARSLNCSRAYVSQVLSGDREPARFHYGARPMQTAKRDKPPTPKVCGRNVLNRETGRVETCTAPRHRLAGETMGCCEDCYNRTRPLGSVTSSYGRI